MKVAFLIGLLVNITSTAGKKLLREITGVNSIEKKVDKAFTNALKKWTVNKDIRRRESYRLSDKVTLIRQIVSQYEFDKPLDKGTQKLLNLFKTELMQNGAYNLLIDTYFNYLIKDVSNLSGRIENVERVVYDIKNLVIDYLITNEPINKSDSIEFLPVAIRKSVKELPKNHFIKKIIGEPYYIPRTLVDIQNLSTELEPFNETGNKTYLTKILFTESRLVLLGSAGTGKSVELKETAINLAENNICYPILLSLNIYTPDVDIENILPKEWHLVPEDELILFFDGLDEIEPLHFNSVKRKISQFLSNHEDIKIVISCRTNFYDLPGNNKVGTLRDFKPYYLNQLTFNDIKEYVTENHSLDGDKFINEIYANRLIDIVFNPFFLKLIIQFYLKNDLKLSRNRSNMFLEFINSRFEFDKNHYSDTYNIRDKKFEALNLLRKVSLAMEVIGIKVIEESDLRKLINVSSDFELIKHCTVFKKEEGESEIWKFEHNYFQEFLCAELLAKQPFKVVKSFVSNDELEKVLPSWFNTVGQLISILDENSDLFGKLTQWLIENDIEVLVNVEREKFSPKTREKIFVLIFEYYRNLKIWIDSNKFQDKDLAYFGQSNNSIDYTVNIVKDIKENRIVRLNALSVLGSFSLKDYPSKNSLRNTLIRILKEKLDDSYFAYSVIRTIHDCLFYDKLMVDKVFNIAGAKNSQYIRASMYRLLNSSQDLEKYVDYFLEGYKLTIDGGIGREKTNFMDEGWGLREGIRSFKSVKSLTKILNFCTNEDYIDRNFEIEEMLKGIVSNCVKAYYQSPEIFSKVYEVFRYYSDHYSYHNQLEIIIPFFKQTNTIQKAFNNILTEIGSGNDDYLIGISLSHFVDDDNYIEIISAYLNGKISDIFLQRFYWQIVHTKPEIAEKYKAAVDEKTPLKIELAKRIDLDNIIKAKRQKSFDILFDIGGFIEECNRIFGDRDELKNEELSKLNRSSFDYSETEDFFIDSVLVFMRKFAQNYSTIKRKTLNSWLQNPNNYEQYFIGEIYHYLKTNNDLKVDEGHKRKIKDWFDKNIDKFDFTKAVELNNDGTFSIKNKASFLSFFARKFDFDCKENVWLDMLSFAFDNMMGMETITIEYILEKVSSPQKVDKRVIKNINNHKVLEFSVYETHVKHALKNELNQCYPTIIRNLGQLNDEPYRKNIIIDLFFKSVEDISGLKRIFNKLETEVQLNLLQKLIQRNEIGFVVRKLRELSKTVSEPDTKRSINNLLITAKQIAGLKNSIEWIKANKKSPFSQNGQTLAYYTSIKSLPYLIKLLELSYDSSIATDHTLDRMWGIVVNGLEFLALASRDNYRIVTSRMKSFIKENKGKIDNVEFLNRPIENIKNKFYSTVTVEFDMESAINKIKSLIDEVSKPYPDNIGIQEPNKFNEKTDVDGINTLATEKAKKLQTDFPESYNLYFSATKKYRIKGFERNVLDDLRLSLEVLLKSLLQNNKSLENQLQELGEYQKNRGASNEVTNMFQKLIDYFSKYQNRYIKHNDNVPKSEVSLIFDLTTTFISYLLKK